MIASSRFVIRRAVAAVGVAGFAAASAAPAIAQATQTARASQPTQPTRPGEPLKRATLPSVLRPACPVAGPAPASPSDRQRAQARDLASRGLQSAILGDTAAALTSLRDARRLDPTDPDLAYQLARIYESGAATDSAVSEYCRFLTLAPNTSDAADARNRVSVLAKPTADPSIEAANTIFQEGLAAYDAGRMADADARFTRTIAAQPAWGDVYYNRAVVRLAEGMREPAATDFEVYLRVKPTAADRPAVTARIDGLRRPRYSAGAAFGWGIVIPGAGQFYTQRPGWGTATLLSAGAALGAAFVSQNKTTTEPRTGTDPFGNPYTFTATTTKADHPYLIPGLVAAGTISVIGAIEAAVHASSSNYDGAAPARVSLIALPSRNALALRIAY
jgi:tetratricopeptide (TPR) repeat protein